MMWIEQGQTHWLNSKRQGAKERTDWDLYT